MATSSYTGGLTTADQTAALNSSASNVANKPALSTAQPAAMTGTAQPGIIAGAMNSTSLPTNDASAWYSGTLGRDADASGLAYWNNRLSEKGADPNSIYSEFLNSAVKNGESISIPGKNGPANPATAATYTPTLNSDPAKWNITPDQTVAGQLKSLIDPNNPYYQQWKTNGAQDAAARGFTGNSTLRDTGILSAVMNSATPIAQSDASTYSKAAGYNTDQTNQTNAANVAAQNAAGAANAAAQNALNNANISANTQKYVSDQSAETQKAVAAMSAKSQAEISAAHDANSVLLANNSSAQAAYSAYVNAVANIDIQPSMDLAAKEAAIVTQTQLFNSQIDGLKAAQPNLAGTGSPLDIAIKEAGGVDVTNILNGG